MEQRDRLAYYKRLTADGIALTDAQRVDYDLIIRERGVASSEALPSGGAKHTEATIKL